jgi:rsbT co-antagonist protein RsbR
MTNQTGQIQVDIAGFNVVYDLNRGVQLFAGNPTISMWTETSVAGLMLGLSRMVGVERFNLAMQSGGRDSVDGDMEFISRFSTFEEGFAALSVVASAAGWGLWEIVSLDRDTKQGTFRCQNSWEGMYQRALSVCWGSAMVAGKFAGMLTRLFGENCWAEQTSFQARGDDFDEFHVHPSNKTIEGDLEALLVSDAATRADLAVALERLRKEVDERRAAEDALRRTEHENFFLIAEQRKTIAAMSTPHYSGMERHFDGAHCRPDWRGPRGNADAAIARRYRDAFGDACDSRFNGRRKRRCGDGRPYLANRASG